MEKRRVGSCTTILAGKKATIDGSTLISRNADGHEAFEATKFILIEPEAQVRHYKAVLSSVEMDLPDNPLRYTCTPNAVYDHGIWGSAAINEENVAMSATETITTNPRILALDPLVENGIGEEDLVTIVAPYIRSAKEGVLRLGELLATYGTYESNGIAFCDADEVWYLETLGGHHWAAVRIPDDAYVIAPNRLNIDTFDFNSPDCLASSDLQALITENHLNPDYDGYNLRHIFGSSTVKDTRYNNPRAWYGQKYFNPEIQQEPMDQNLPFINRANRLISIEDVKWVLSSHYQNTVYDCYGHGSEAEKKLFRPIGINRNHHVHILQIRNHVPKEIAGVHWLGFGPNTFNAVIPFYANVKDTPACYRDATDTFDLSKMYWLSATTALLGDSNFSLYSDLEASFEQKTVAACRKIQQDTDRKIAEATDVSATLTAANEAMAAISFANATALLGEMVTTGGSSMKLRYTLND
ncbi:C69 family dipeptidase [Enterococcus nangangensis]|uniref:C69 family dipeptidase n=1 Tax=Enterococcus nangangensis TaxID=2559926 RepID=UPI0010F49010|nr:C69 family dipeptidase [Enterococcus nangangensis]